MEEASNKSWELICPNACSIQRPLDSDSLAISRPLISDRTDTVVWTRGAVARERPCDAAPQGFNVVIHATMLAISFGLVVIVELVQIRFYSTHCLVESWGNTCV